MATKYTTWGEEALLAHDTRMAELTKRYIDKNKGANILIANEDAGMQIRATDEGEFKLKIDNANAFAISQNTLELYIPNDIADLTDLTDKLPKRTTTTPKMAGTAAVGTENAWAAGDHVHPTDTSRASKLEFDTVKSAVNSLEVRLAALTASTPEDLDTLKEIVEYIKANRTLIESVTTTKVNVSDMVVINPNEAAAIAQTACEAVYV